MLKNIKTEHKRTHSFCISLDKSINYIAIPLNKTGIGTFNNSNRETINLTIHEVIVNGKFFQKMYHFSNIDTIYSIRHTTMHVDNETGCITEIYGEGMTCKFDSKGMFLRCYK